MAELTCTGTWKLWLAFRNIEVLRCDGCHDFETIYRGRKYTISAELANNRKKLVRYLRRVS